MKRFLSLLLFYVFIYCRIANAVMSDFWKFLLVKLWKFSWWNQPGSSHYRFLPIWFFPLCCLCSGFSLEFKLLKARFLHWQPSNIILWFCPCRVRISARQQQLKLLWRMCCLSNVKLLPRLDSSALEAKESQTVPPSSWVSYKISLLLGQC